MCRNLGLDFGTVDMRWGVKEEMTMEHGVTAMCLAEVERSVLHSIRSRKSDVTLIILQSMDYS